MIENIFDDMSGCWHCAIGFWSCHIDSIENFTDVVVEMQDHADDDQCPQDNQFEGGMCNHKSKEKNKKELGCDAPALLFISLSKA